MKVNYEELVSLHCLYIRKDGGVKRLAHDMFLFSDPNSSQDTQSQPGGVFFLHYVVSNSLRPRGLCSPESSLYGIPQARIPEWVAMSFSRGSSPPRNRTHVCCSESRLFTI